jgi:hypothetical protein
MKTNIVAAALALLIGACAERGPQSAPASQAAGLSAETGPCATDFLTVTAGKPQCEIALQADGSLALATRHTEPIAVSYNEGAGSEGAVLAERLILFPPSPRNGIRILQACDGVAEDSLCWAVRLMHRDRADLIPIIAGKYGPDRWIRWSPHERKVALISRNEGAMWLHIVDTESGVTVDFPGPDTDQNWQIEPDSFAWSGEEAFSVKVKTCETCALEERRITLPAG